MLSIIAVSLPSNCLMGTHWANMKKQLGIKPLGLNATEVSSSRYFGKESTLSPDGYWCKDWYDHKCNPKDIEFVLVRNNLIKVIMAGA